MCCGCGCCGWGLTSSLFCLAFLSQAFFTTKKESRLAAILAGFYARRAKRILPPYVIVMLLATIFIDTVWLKYWYMYVGGMNFVAAFRPDSAAPLPLWSLAVEEQFYLLWPLAVYWLDRKNLIRCASWHDGDCAHTAVCVYAVFFEREWAIYMLLPFRMDTIATGALVALLWPETEGSAGGNAEAALADCWGAGTALGAISLGCLYVLDIHKLSPVSNTAHQQLCDVRVHAGPVRELFL